MIFDSLKNSALYYPVSPRLEKAFGFIASGHNYFVRQTTKDP